MASAEAAGTSLADRGRWEAFLAPFCVLPSTAAVSWEYGRAYRDLRENGRLIGGNDLWIAATGLAYRLPVLTRKRRALSARTGSRGGGVLTNVVC